MESAELRPHAIENPAEWEHLLISPWFTLLRTHDHIWNDKTFELKFRDELCGLLRIMLYNLHIEQCKEKWKKANAGRSASR
jgi:hypothetical protein